jgi:hypothetical protein
MLRLKFKVDKYHLAYKYVLKYFGKSDAPSEWTELKRNLAEKYEAYPGFLFFEPTDVGHGLLWFNRDSQDNAVIRDRETVNKIFEDIFESEVFKKIFSETDNYKNRLERLWSENTSYIFEYEKIIGLQSSVEATVLVLHQEIETGSYISDNIIEWGNPDLYDNYQLIGLCHEFLHILTEKQYRETKTEDEKWLLHSLIYLSADEELRLRVNSDSGYFMSGVVDTYHPLLIETAKKSLTPWKQYIVKRKEKNIIELYEKLRKDD